MSTAERAYADGRADQAEEDMQLLAWAYNKLTPFSFVKQGDALNMGRIREIFFAAAASSFAKREEVALAPKTPAAEGASEMGHPLTDAEIVQLALDAGFPRLIDTHALLTAIDPMPACIRLVRSVLAMSMGGYSCAKRATEPSNEFAACREHCGDATACPHSAPDIETFVMYQGYVRTLTLLTRNALDKPAPHGDQIAEIIAEARDKLEAKSLAFKPSRSI